MEFEQQPINWSTCARLSNGLQKSIKKIIMMSLKKNLSTQALKEDFQIHNKNPWKKTWTIWVWAYVH